MSPDSSLVVANTDGSECKNFIFFIERSQLNFATSLSTAHLSVYKHFIFKQPIVSEERKTVDYPFLLQGKIRGFKIYLILLTWGYLSALWSLLLRLLLIFNRKTSHADN